jgi:hypothetical protein
MPNPPPLLMALRAGAGDFVVVRSEHRPGWYRLLDKKQSRFPLAAGPMSFIMKRYQRLARDHLVRRQ